VKTDSAIVQIPDSVKTDSVVVPKMDSAGVDGQPQGIAPTTDSTMVQTTDSTQTDSTIIPKIDSIPVSSSSSATLPPSSSSAEGQARGPAPTTDSVRVQSPSSSSYSRRDILGPVDVSRVHAIYQMKGKYKSPKQALFMSLLVPGTGQMYVGGSTFNYARGAAYLVVEGALWGSWAYFSVSKYNKAVKRYKNYAKQNYSVKKYEEEMNDIHNTLDVGGQQDSLQLIFGSPRADFCQALYGSVSNTKCENFSTALEFFMSAGPKSFFQDSTNHSGFPTRISNEGAFYRMISENAFVMGWSDAVAEYPLVISSGVIGTSAQRTEYQNLRNKAADYADMQAWFFGGLLLTHSVSAVDAMLAARAHNNALYEEKVSWWDKTRLESDLSVANGFGMRVQASWGF
jgi:hypothetical protein